MPMHEDKVELLRRVDLFSTLREYELDIIAKNSEMVRFDRGVAVFVKGAPARELYVVQGGRVGIIGVESEDNITIAQIAPGESFGELEFLENAPRKAAAFIEEESVLLRFPAVGITMADLLRDHPFVAARTLHRLLGIIAERIWSVKQLLNEKTGWLQDLHRQLHCDRMTGLYNETFLREDFVNLLPRLGGRAALLMIKPDNFKEINDRYGHEAGDHVLKLMAIFLQSELGENDIGVRYRGDEFAAVLADAGRDEALERSRAISASLASLDLSRAAGADAPHVRVSIGIALYPTDRAESRMLVEEAHRKMMAARESGGGRVAI
ncbi:MAG: GGDEF domain-containing protein [Spirochaetes bacterium]|nr:GGDEF domain-containing protein [Spirochaetota bacterium]